MVALADRRMGQYRAESLDRAVSEAAAARAVDDVLIDMLNAGFTPRQAKGIAYAAQEYLVHSPGYRNRARQALTDAGFRNGEVNDLLGEIEQMVTSKLHAA